MYPERPRIRLFRAVGGRVLVSKIQRELPGSIAYLTTKGILEQLQKLLACVEGLVILVLAAQQPLHGGGGEVLSGQFGRVPRGPRVEVEGGHDAIVTRASSLQVRGCCRVGRVRCRVVLAKQKIVGSV
jgi:hypothetical protein